MLNDAGRVALVLLAGGLVLAGCSAGTTRRSLLPVEPTGREERTVEFRERIAGQAVERARELDAATPPSVPEPVASTAPDAAVWWLSAMASGIDDARPDLPVGLQSFYERAIEHSTQIRVFSQIPLIRETGIDEARGRFVPRAFAEGKYDYRNDPVGNTLTTGRDGRFREISRVLEYGLRSRLQTGAETTLSHRVSSVKSNSIFFVPDPQTTSRLAVTVVQPLLRGAGLRYNRSIQDLALIDTQIAKHEFVRQVESHLVEVTRAYWGLHLSRAVHLQKRRLVEETRTLAQRLEGRAEFDAGRVQLIRARAALGEREAEFIRTRIAIDNSTNRLRALVNDPELERQGRIELVTIEEPTTAYGDVDLETVVADAVQRRPEVQQAYLQYEAATVRHGMARNEQRWLLDLILEGSYSGLAEDDVRVGPAIRDGFDANGGVTVGLRFEAPLGRDEAGARFRRRAIELRQQESQVRTTIHTVVLEAQVSAAEYASASAELAQRRVALDAARKSYDTLRHRWEEGLGGQAGVAMLEHLLDAQELLSEAEEDYVTAQVARVVAIANLERAKGNFLGHQRLDAIEVRTPGELPEIRVERAG